MSMVDIDKRLENIKQFRSSYRRKHNELKRINANYDSEYAKSYESTMTEIKTYIDDANDHSDKLCMKDHVVSQERKVNQELRSKFIIDDINRNLSDVHADLNIDVKMLTDDEVQVKKDDFHNIKKKLNQTSKNISQLTLQETAEGEVDEVMQRYGILSSLMSDYERSLKNEVTNRELDKEKLFKESRLNIKLGKFKDFDSAVDIYTFQDDFEKLYLRTTPKRLLPDLLKNNHLENPALLLVKSEDSIEEIWLRLKRAFGDPKIMLSRKLEQLNNLDPIWRLKNSEKIAEGLSKIVTVMKDLLKLSKKHKIEAKLYNGDVLEKIYKRLGDSRITIQELTI